MNTKPIFVVGSHAYRILPTQGTMCRVEYSLFHANGCTHRPGLPAAHPWVESKRVFADAMDAVNFIERLFAGVGGDS